MMPSVLQIPCISSHYYPETIENFKKLSAMLNIEFKAPENATCCGLPYFEKGELKTAKKIGEFNLGVYGDKKLYTCSSKCELTYKQHYPKIFNNTVSHNPAVNLAKETMGLKDLLSKLPAGMLENIEGDFFLVLDCCSDEWLKETVKKMPMVRWHFSKMNATCCGAGTSMPTVSPNLSSEMASNIIFEFRESGAEAMVFQDDICRKHVENVALAGNMQIKTMNFVDILIKKQI